MKNFGYCSVFILGFFIMISTQSVTHAQIIPEPDFRMIGYATISEGGFETTTGGAGGDIIVIETLAQLRNWGADREDQIPYEYSIEDVSTLQLSVQENTGVGKLSSVTGIHSVIVPSSLNIAGISFNSLFHHLQIKYGSTKFQPVTVSVFSMDGKRIIQEQIKLDIGSHSITLPLKHYHAGVFIIIIENEVFSYSGKVILN